MTEEPNCTEKRPLVVELEPGNYAWCACGRTGNDPWCDGTHRTTEFRPKKFDVTEKRTYAICRCRRSANAPFCDGTHKTL